MKGRLDSVWRGSLVIVRLGDSMRELVDVKSEEIIVGDRFRDMRVEEGL